MATRVRGSDAAEKAKEWVAAFNAHFVSTADDACTVLPVAEQALKGKTTIETCFGAPVGWPSAQQLPAESAEEAAERLKEKFGSSQ
eukprot:1467730-Pyramimonas_sp.AAC.1